MKKIVGDILRLLRCRHYIKNLLIFVPLFFSGKFFDLPRLWSAGVGFICFSMTASFIYIVNDICDVEKDRRHPVKCRRPIASGRVSTGTAKIAAGICLLLSFLFGFIMSTHWHYILIVTYIILNILYSRRLKNIPLIDVVILVSGFVIRVAYGGLLADILVSSWLYLTIISGAFYLGLGKRRNELAHYESDNTREVLSHYNIQFLDKNMYMCMGLANAFYSLWAMSNDNKILILTSPVVLLITMRYSLAVEGAVDGDPVEVIWKDKFIWGLGIIYIVILVVAQYWSFG